MKKLTLLGTMIIGLLFVFGPLTHGAQTNIYFRILGSGESLTGEEAGGNNPYINKNRDDGQTSFSTGITSTGFVATGTRLTGNTLSGSAQPLDPWEIVYNWAKPYGLTNSSKYIPANFQMPLSRIEMARIVTTFVKNYYGKTITPDWRCDISQYTDYETLTAKERTYVKDACDLGLMGWQRGKVGLTTDFRPRALVGRETLAIVLTRMLYGSRYDDGGGQIDILVKAGYMVDLEEPLLIERRGYLMTLLKRIADKPPMFIYAVNFIPDKKPAIAISGIPAKPTSSTAQTGTSSATTSGTKETSKDTTTDSTNQNSALGSAPAVNDLTLYKAFEWAQKFDIATIKTYDEEALLSPMTRAELARVMVLVSTKVTHVNPAVKTNCNVDNFTDEKKISSQFREYIATACAVGLMGTKSDGKTIIESFRPNDIVTRAEFATILSRFLYGDTYQQEGELWYEKHLQKMNQEGFIKRINNPNMQELKGYVMIIIQRIQEKLYPIL